MDGLRIVPGYLDRAAQDGAAGGGARRVRARAALHAAHAEDRQADVGAHDQLRAARLGDRRERGYRYQPTHPETGDAVAADARRRCSTPGASSPTTASAPEACLINVYGPDAKMGLHQDRDEQDFDAPVVSLSLGDTCLFRIGGTKRSDPTRSVRLASGDAVVLGGAARLAFHGVDRIMPGTSTLLPEGGRINLTMRRVTRP